MSQETTKHILIVDDQRSTARALRNRLAAVDPSFSVIDIPSGEEALLEIQGRDFDVVISDSRLSGMSGAEFMARALRRRADLRFLVISRSNMDEVYEAFAGQDVLGFFEKPGDLPALVDAVSELLLGEAAPTEAPAPEPAPQAAEDQPTLIASLLVDIQTELGASAVALADREGRILARPAAPNPPQRFDDLVYRLAGQPDEGSALAAVLGDRALGSIAFHTGVETDLYALSISEGEARFTLVVTLPSAGRPPGEVVNHLHRVGQERLTALFGPQAEAEAPVEFEAEQPADLESKDSPDQEGDHVPPFIDLDLENVDSQLDTGALDSFWEEEASRDTLNGDVLSMDEAIELGLIPEELNDDDE